MSDEIDSSSHRLFARARTSLPSWWKTLSRTTPQSRKLRSSRSHAKSTASRLRTFLRSRYSPCLGCRPWTDSHLISPQRGRPHASGPPGPLEQGAASPRRVDPAEALRPGAHPLRAERHASERNGQGAQERAARQYAAGVGAARAGSRQDRSREGKAVAVLVDHGNIAYDSF